MLAGRTDTFVKTTPKITGKASAPVNAVIHVNSPKSSDLRTECIARFKENSPGRPGL